MNQLASPTSLAGRLMMGPDGAVYALRTGTPLVPPPDGLSSAAAPSLSRRSSEGGEGTACFRYSIDVPRMDGGQGSSCFRYSAEALAEDGGSATGCFSFAAEVPGDGGTGSGCFRFSAEVPGDGGQGTGCFAY